MTENKAKDLDGAREAYKTKDVELTKNAHA